MTERKVWTHQQDDALRSILAKGIKKWNSVAEAMERQYKIIGRTGKQCRQRWHNQLDPKINNETWSPEEEKILFDLHQKMGNRWAKISNNFKGRTDNSVKNHFYSTLRKAFRRLNRHLNQSKIQKNKQLKNIILTKLLSAAEDRFSKKLGLSDEVIKKSIDLKNRLISLSHDIDIEKQTVKQMNSLIDELIDFTKSWKRKKRKGKKQLDQLGQNSQFSEQQQQQSSLPTKYIKKVYPKIIKKPSAPESPPPPLIKRQSSRLSKKQSFGLPLMTHKSSNKQSFMQNQPNISFRLRSNPSYVAQQQDFFLMKKRSSFSSFALFPRISDAQIMPRAAINFDDSFYNKTQIKNLFSTSDVQIQRLDDK